VRKPKLWNSLVEYIGAESRGQLPPLEFFSPPLLDHLRISSDPCLKMDYFGSISQKFPSAGGSDPLASAAGSSDPLASAAGGLAPRHSFRLIN